MNGPDPRPRRAPARTTRSRLWRWSRYALALGLAGLAAWVISGKADELSGADAYLSRIRWGWLVAAAAAELLSYVSFAGMQRRLLAAGKVAVALTPLTGVSLAGNAIQISLPAGVVLSSAYSYRQYRRFGADEVLAGWVLVAMLVLSLMSLSVLAAAGLAMAASTGSALDLASVIIGLVAVMAAVVGLWSKRAWVASHAVGAVRLAQRVSRRPAGDAGEWVATARERLGSVAPRRRDWAAASVMAAGNWVLDLLCLAAAFAAIGTGVPWQGLLLAYGAAQLAANLPITPGGLGVVEGSLTIALVAFGGAEASTVAAVLVYRLCNFWGILPLGWGAWGVLGWRARRQAEVPAAVAGPDVEVP